MRVSKDRFNPSDNEVHVRGTAPHTVRVALVPLESLSPDPDPKVPRAIPAPDIPYRTLIIWVFESGGSIVITTELGRSEPLRELAQVPRYQFRLHGIDLSNTSVTDEDLDHLSDSPQLQSLSLANTSITDGGIPRLSCLANLSALDLSSTSIRNTGLEHLKRLGRITDLKLDGTEITDQGLAHLRSLKTLQTLSLMDTKIGDAAADHLAELTGLRQLAVNGTGVTESGHDALSRTLPDLTITWDGRDLERMMARELLSKGASLTVLTRSGQTLDQVHDASELPIERFHVTAVDMNALPRTGDDDLKLLAGFARIESLNIDGTSVSADGLLHLHGLQSLQRIDLGSLPLAKSSVDALRRTLADCDISQREAQDPIVASWVLAHGGRVTIVSADGQRRDDISDPAALPSAFFRVAEVYLNDVAEVSDDDLVNIAELPGLESYSWPGRELRTRVCTTCRHVARCGNYR